MKKVRRTTILDDRNWSPLWERYLRAATVFDPLKAHEITCIVPIPGRSGVILFTTNGIFCSSQSALKTLQHFAFAHCFPEYTILASVLKDIGEFGKYKFPWACPYFTLFPLETIHHTIWINPLKIEDIYTVENQYYARVIDGPDLYVPISRYYILLRAEIACGILAAIRQDAFHYSMLGTCPSDYVPLSNTTFSISLGKRTLLNQFVTRTCEINRRYQRARFLHYYDQLVDNPENLSWENWS